MSITLKSEIEKTSIVFSKKESFKISEDIWRSNIGENITRFEVEKDTEVMKRKKLAISVVKGQTDLLSIGTIISLAEGIDDTKFEGAVTICFKKPGAKPLLNPLIAGVPDEVEYVKLKQVKEGMWGNCQIFSEYKTDKFLKEYLEDGFVRVEVNTKLSLKKNLVDGRITRKGNLDSDIKNLSGKKETCDFLVICKDKRFPCHKAILSARSSVFSNMFLANMLEAATGKWEVMDSTPEAVQHMMDFIYSGEIDYASMQKRPVEMLHLANFYDLPDLAAAAKETMLRQLLPENAVSTLVNFERYAATDEEVKKEVMGFIKRNAKDVVDSKDWDVFQQNYSTLVKDIVKGMAE